METKTFEILDEGTFIPVLAIRLQPGCERDRFILSRGGYGTKPADQEGYFLLVNLSSQKASHDPHGWSYARTLREAHLYIERHWDGLQTGDVIDVQFILGETTAPKKSEQELMPVPEAAGWTA